MIGEGPEGVMFIGLHRVAVQKGDGLIPELFAILTDERRQQAENLNVAAFPLWQARPPARDIPFVSAGQAQNETGDNVIAFPRCVEQVQRRTDLPETG